MYRPVVAAVIDYTAKYLACGWWAMMAEVVCSGTLAKHVPGVNTGMEKLCHDRAT